MKSGGRRPNAGRNRKYVEESKQISLKVPCSKVEEVKNLVNSFLDEFMLKSINDLLEIGYKLSFIESRKQWWLLDKSNELIIGFDNLPNEKEMNNRCYSISKNKEISSVFL